MNETVINILADRLEKQAGDIAILNGKLTELQVKADKYYKWWTEEQELTTKLEKRIVGLELKLKELELTDLTVELGPFITKAETRNE